MGTIRLLDCTLRDGGYVNNWKFGKKNISKIIQNVVLSGIDIIECGYLSLENSGNADEARFCSIDDVMRVYTDKREEQNFAVMINLGEYPSEQLEDADEDSPIIRVAFHKKDLEEAFVFFGDLEEKGYCYYVQPMGALNYSDEEYVHLINRVNHLKAEAFYIVDSFGVMELRDFRRLIFLADNNLDKKIALGYHSHNNLQQAYSNSKYMAEQNLVHDLIIDASVFGMGRGAGNLNIELFAEYLNQNYKKNYNIEPILEVFDECLKPIFMNHFWGYSLPYYLSSIHNCHPNYANYFSEKNTLSVKSMHGILSMISEEDKAVYSVDKANYYYERYQEKPIDDSAAIKKVKEKIENRMILILAPGFSINKYSGTIRDFIEKEKPVVFGINEASPLYEYDFLFITNEKRISYKYLPENVKKYILTSNLQENLEAFYINYTSYLCETQEISDNPTLMLINFLEKLGIYKISIAGFDGFHADPSKNYFEKDLSLGSNIESKMKKNKFICKEVKKISERLELKFLTPSLYLKEC